METISLKQKAIKGVFWSSLDKVVVKLISFGVAIVIARILTPAEYGIIGMVMVFIVISNILIDSGLGQALIQKQDKDDLDKSTVFFFNILISLFCYIALFFLAPLIADFYEMHILTPVLRVLGINLLINSLTTVQRADLQGTLNFRKIAIVNVSAVIISGCVGIVLAYSDFGVWALVFQQMVSAFISALVYWIVGNWRPEFVFSFKSLKSLWKFGSKLLTAGLIATGLREVYTVTIGKFYRASELGFYSRAVQTSDMVAITTNEMINAVTFPILSSLQDDRSKLVEVYSKMLGMTAFFIIPIMTLLAVFAKPIVLILLTEKWLPSVILLQWLCFARMFTPISSLNMNILNAVGRSDLFLKVDMAKYPLLILCMVITIPIGVEAIVIGNFVNTFICYFINAYLPGKLFGFGVKAQFRIFWKIIIADFFLVAGGILIIFCFQNSVVQLVLGGILSISLFSLCSHFLKLKEWTEFKTIISSTLLKVINK